MAASFVQPEPVKVLVAVLWNEPTSLESALSQLRAEWGELDVSGPDRAFDTTDFYVEEMGANLVRRLVSHVDLVSPDFLATAKRRCQRIEEELSINGRRRVNLDVGYLDHNKIVLASLKAAGQKIYLDQGVYADLTARFSAGRYRPFEWTFPDLRDGRYDEELARMREIYKRQRRDAERNP